MLIAQINAASHQARAMGSPPGATQRLSIENVSPLSRHARCSFVKFCKRCLTRYAGLFRDCWLWICRFCCCSPSEAPRP